MVLCLFVEINLKWRKLKEEHNVKKLLEPELYDGHFLLWGTHCTPVSEIGTANRLDINNNI